MMTLKRSLSTLVSQQESKCMKKRSNNYFKFEMKEGTNRRETLIILVARVNSLFDIRGPFQTLVDFKPRAFEEKQFLEFVTENTFDDRIDHIEGLLENMLSEAASKTIPAEVTQALCLHTKGWSKAEEILVTLRLFAKYLCDIEMCINRCRYLALEIDPSNENVHLCIEDLQDALTEMFDKVNLSQVFEDAISGKPVDAQLFDEVFHDDFLLIDLEKVDEDEDEDNKEEE